MRPLLPDGWLPGGACSHAYVSEEGDIAVFSGVRGSDPLTGQIDGQDFVQEVSRAAMNVAALIDAAAIRGKPRVHVRLHVRNQHAYVKNIEAVSAILRRALEGREASVTVVAAPKLIDPRAAIEFDGVVASQ